MNTIEKLTNYTRSIDKTEIMQYLNKDISDSTFEKNLPEIALIYMVSTNPEVDMNYVRSCFFDIYKDKEGGESEAKYRFCQICLILNSKIKMDVEILRLQEDFIDWGTLSARKDLTMEVIEKFYDKIEFDKIQVDFGKDFINQNLGKMGRGALKFKLSKKNIDDLVNIHGYRIFDLSSSNQYNEKFILRHLDKVKPRDATNLANAIRRFDFSFEEIMMILDHMENSINDECLWNEIISVAIEKKYLTLPQKKDIKYRCTIICEHPSNY